MGRFVSMFLGAFAGTLLYNLVIKKYIENSDEE